MKSNQGILDYFHILEKNSSSAASYLFIGRDFTLLDDILKVISCENDSYFCSSCWDCKMIEAHKHPDLFCVEPQGLNTRIDKIREAIHFLYLKSFRLKKKIVILKDGNSLSPAAANAFLKTLEEPPGNSFIAICVSKLDGILPTIISRCRKIFLPFNTEGDALCGFDIVAEFLKGGKVVFKDRVKFSSFLWTLIVFLHNDLLFKTTGRGSNIFAEDKQGIFFNFYDAERIHNALNDVLKIYSVYKSININLALNLIRLKLN